MIKSIILSIFIVLFCSFNIKNNIIIKPLVVWQNSGIIFRDLGSYYHAFNDGSYLRIYAYIVKKPNNSEYYSQYKYEYVLTAISESYNNTRICETWLYNNRIYMDNDEITMNQFPNGTTTYISTSPTPIYSWFTNENTIGSFYMKWTNAVYENR